MHFYNSVDGRVLPSVTTILEMTMKGESRYRLTNFYTANPAAAFKKRDMARARGNQLHRLIEAYLCDRPMVAIESQYGIYFRRLLPFLDLVKLGAEQISCEQVVFDLARGYAGTADAIALRNGAAILVDWKTKDFVSPAALQEAKLQSLAYAEAVASAGQDVEAIAVGIATKKDCQVYMIDNGSEEWIRLSQEWGDRLRSYVPPTDLGDVA